MVANTIRGSDPVEEVLVSNDIPPARDFESEQNPSVSPKRSKKIRRGLRQR